MFKPKEGAKYSENQHSLWKNSIVESVGID